MVKSGDFFSRLVSVEALFSLNGVIRFVTGFQHWPISLIKQPDRALLTDCQPQAKGGTPYPYSGKGLIFNQPDNARSGQRYPLAYYFYGFICWLAGPGRLRPMPFDATQPDLTAAANHEQDFTRYVAGFRWLLKRYDVLAASVFTLPPFVLPLSPVNASLPAPSPVPVFMPFLRHRRRVPEVTALLALFPLHGCAMSQRTQLTGRRRVRRKLPSAPSTLGGDAARKQNDTAPLPENGSRDLTPCRQIVLTTLAPKTARSGQRRRPIVVHPGNIAPAAVNSVPSGERVHVICNWFIEHTGVAAGLTVEGPGNSRLTDRHTTLKGCARNLLRQNCSVIYTKQ